jgi:hypothetical protein
MTKSIGAAKKHQPQFNVRQQADWRLKFLLWLAEHRQIEGQSSWIGARGRTVQTTDWLFVAATALLARIAPHDLALALAAFAQKAGISYDVKTEARVCGRACRAINRRQGGRWVSASKAGGYLQVSHHERRAYYELTGTFPNVDPVGESAIVKRGRKTAERRERQRDWVRAKRRANGTLARGQYRAKVKRKTLPPYEALGMKKWAYYRRLKAGTLVTAVTPRANSERRPPSPPKTPSGPSQHKNLMEFLQRDTSLTRRDRDLTTGSLASLSQASTHRVAGSALKSLENSENLGDIPSCTRMAALGGVR